MTERLRDFIRYLNIQISAFADTCNIKRPTLSQILNGRNQTINNNIIESIHTAYPQLSIGWLLFGEGTMLVDGEPANNCIVHETDSPDLLSMFDENRKIPSNESDNSKYENLSASNVLPKKNDVITPNSNYTSKSAIQSKTISKIMIFYSDNSFESFSPDCR